LKKPPSPDPFPENGGASGWTAGCIALSDEDMKNLFPLMEERDEVMILR
jgi:L,D-peptidoglycan transpeptidase YkuD (ErfK/YbiS/YcfS/YnhG family)